jgi:hypothetical protein
MATKAERRAARERVSAYHESQLAGLLGQVGAEIDRYRAGEVDAYAADETIHHYARSALGPGASKNAAAASLLCDLPSSCCVVRSAAQCGSAGSSGVGFSGEVSSAR